MKSKTTHDLFMKKVLLGNLHECAIFIKHLAQDSVDVPKFLDTIDSNGKSALELAIWCGYTEIVSLLIDNGADMNHVGASGMSAFVLAVKNLRPEIIQYLDWKSSKSHEGGVLSQLKEANQAFTQVHPLKKNQRQYDEVKSYLLELQNLEEINLAGEYFEDQDG